MSKYITKSESIKKELNNIIVNNPHIGKDERVAIKGVIKMIEKRQMTRKNNKVVKQITEASFVAPKIVPYSLVESKFIRMNKGVTKRGKKPSNIVVHKGVYMTIPEASEVFNIPYSALYQRIKNGWDLVRAFGVESHRVDHYITENLEMMRK